LATEKGRDLMLPSSFEHGYVPKVEEKTKRVEAEKGSSERAKRTRETKE